MPRDEVLLADILRYARQAARAAAGLTAAELDADPDRQSMVLWPLIALGEAAAHVSEACRAAHPDIPWRRMVGLRNVLVHDYSGTDMVAVIEVAHVHVPDLIQRLEAMDLGD